MCPPLSDEETRRGAVRLRRAPRMWRSACREVPHRRDASLRCAHGSGGVPGRRRRGGCDGDDGGAGGVDAPPAAPRPRRRLAPDVVPAAGDRRVRRRARRRHPVDPAGPPRRDGGPGRPAHGARRAVEPRPDHLHRERAGHLVRRLRRLPQPQELCPVRHRPARRPRARPPRPAAVAGQRPGAGAARRARHDVGQLGDGRRSTSSGSAWSRPAWPSPWSGRVARARGRGTSRRSRSTGCWAPPSTTPCRRSDPSTPPPSGSPTCPARPTPSVNELLLDDRIKVLAGPWDTAASRRSRRSRRCTSR